MTDKPSSLNDLLIAQIVGLIRATAEQAVQDNPGTSELEMESYFLRFIGANCTAKGDALAGLVKGMKSKDD